MAAYTLNAQTITYTLNAPPSIVGIILLPTLGTRLLWQRGDGSYYVIIP